MTDQPETTSFTPALPIDRYGLSLEFHATLQRRFGDKLKGEAPEIQQFLAITAQTMAGCVLEGDTEGIDELESGIAVLLHGYGIMATRETKGMIRDTVFLLARGAMSVMLSGAPA